eukprot:scaffold102900_cov30-Tisochrysis_lutea.AAC.3
MEVHESAYPSSYLLAPRCAYAGYNAWIKFSSCTFVSPPMLLCHPYLIPRVISTHCVLGYCNEWKRVVFRQKCDSMSMIAEMLLEPVSSFFCFRAVWIDVSRGRECAAFPPPCEGCSRFWSLTMKNT